MEPLIVMMVVMRMVTPCGRHNVWRGRPSKFVILLSIDDDCDGVDNNDDDAGDARGDGDEHIFLATPLLVMTPHDDEVDCVGDCDDADDSWACVDGR